MSSCRQEAPAYRRAKAMTEGHAMPTAGLAVNVVAWVDMIADEA